MSEREPIEIIELDLDYCALTFGTAPCTAALSAAVPHKCFNTFYTCADKPNYDKTTKTYRFVQARSNYPVGATTFPCLLSSSGRSSTVNIAGADDRMSSFGRRAEVTADFVDFPYHDRFADKYQAQRISGAAQFSGVGYDPATRGTFWGKLKARNQNYANRPMRIITGYLDGGILTVETTRHFVITNMTGPDADGRVSITGKDVLTLADDDKAVAPAQSSAMLSEAMDATGAASVTLIPAGIGADLASSGYASIGSELVRYTLSGDVASITERGVSGTTSATHAVNDTFQPSYSPRQRRVDYVLRDLIRDYAGVPDAFIPFADWQAEIQRWAPYLLITSDILKPEGVNKLVGELAALGIAIWWDDVDQEVKLKVVRPPDLDAVADISDRNNIVDIEQEDRDEDRLTQVLFNTIVIDASKSATDQNNYARGTLLIDSEAVVPEGYGDTRIKVINCRWLNDGNEGLVRILARRMLNQFNRAPKRFVVDLDYSDDLALTDVMRLDSITVQDATGLSAAQLMQIIAREDIVQGHRVRVTAQAFAFDGRYAYITEDTRPTYTLSSDAQRLRGAYFVDGTLKFGDGTGPYLMS